MDRPRLLEASARTVVGRALSSREDCSYHSVLVLKYGIAIAVVGYLELGMGAGRSAR